MIEVSVYRNADGEIREVKIEGHAGYADPGEDLVCAGVSSVTFGIANAIEELLGIQAIHSMGKSGFLHFVLPEAVPADTRQKLQLLMEAMLVSLRTIEESYSRYISIREL